MNTSSKEDYKYKQENTITMEQMTISDALQFAIEQEKQSVEIYETLLTKADTVQSKEFFKHFIDIEKGHELKLRNFKTAWIGKSKNKSVIDLKLSDYLVERNLYDKLSTADILVIAAKREERTKQLYIDLAKKYVDNTELNELFQYLANEEAQHKHDIEKLHDELIYQTN